MLLLEKEHELERLLAGYKRVAVAFSGGADSSLLLRKAIDVLGRENILALTARSCLQRKGDIANATSWLARHGYDGQVRHEIIELDPLSREEFIQNPPDRCYGCKLHVYKKFAEICAKQGIQAIIDGTNFDDMNSDRPGLRALEELGIGSPLGEAGLTKEEVRRLSREPPKRRLQHLCLLPLCPQPPPSRFRPLNRPR